MNLAVSLTIAVLFGAGASLLVGRDLVRVAAGTVLMSNAALLYVLAAGLSRGDAPIEPIGSPGATSDPLVQALALTAIVISFGVTALVVALVFRVHRTHDTLDLRRLAEIEAEQEEADDAADREDAYEEAAGHEDADRETGVG